VSRIIEYRGEQVEQEGELQTMCRCEERNEAGRDRPSKKQNGDEAWPLGRAREGASELPEIFFGLIAFSPPNGIQDHQLREDKCERSRMGRRKRVESGHSEAWRSEWTGRQITVELCLVLQ
jgi:hypothetical protein